MRTAVGWTYKFLVANFDSPHDQPHVFLPQAVARRLDFLLVELVWLVSGTFEVNRVTIRVDDFEKRHVF